MALICIYLCSCVVMSRFGRDLNPITRTVNIMLVIKCICLSGASQTTKLKFRLTFLILSTINFPLTAMRRVQKRPSLLVTVKLKPEIISQGGRELIVNGRFPFSQNFRNFWFRGKWNTFRRFVPLENSQKKWKI